MADEMSKQGRRVHFSGRVQGVGFRYTTVRIAAAFRVAGYVQNLPDGTVRVVAEGDPSELERFIAEVRAQMSAYIRDVQSDAVPATGQFDDFVIRH
jgi:acylphosphatase